MNEMTSEQAMQEELFDTIRNGLLANPYHYKLYIALAEYYKYRKRPKQAFISYAQAKFYCDNESDRASIAEQMEELKTTGAAVPRTSAVILSYDLKDYTIQCVESVRRTTSREDVDIIVVDNGSTDGSAEWLKEQGDITLRCNEKNVGYTVGCDQGIALAQKDTDIFLMHNDAVLTPNALFWLKIGLYEAKEVGSCGSCSNQAPNFQALYEELPDPGAVMQYALQSNVPMKYPYEPKLHLSFFSVLLKREAMDRVGLLDESFFYSPACDIDYGVRVRLAGYENVLCHNSVVLHYGGEKWQRKKK